MRHAMAAYKQRKHPAIGGDCRAEGLSKELALSPSADGPAPTYAPAGPKAAACLPGPARQGYTCPAYVGPLTARRRFLTGCSMT